MCIRDSPDSLLQAVKALGTGIGVIRPEHGGDLVVAHGVDAGIPSSLFAQKTLSLQQCREMALQYNKEMAASVKQTES